MLEENEIASPLLKVRPHGTNGTHRTPWDIAVNFAKLAILCFSGLRSPGRQQLIEKLQLLHTGRTGGAGHCAVSRANKTAIVQ